jgi:hypothetical protein
MFRPCEEKAVRKPDSSFKFLVFRSFDHDGAAEREEEEVFPRGPGILDKISPVVKLIAYQAAMALAWVQSFKHKCNFHTVGRISSKLLNNKLQLKT